MTNWTHETKVISVTAIAATATTATVGLLGSTIVLMTAAGMEIYIDVSATPQEVNVAFQIGDTLPWVDAQPEHPARSEQDADGF